MRGKLGQRDLVDPEAGFIPAHAGKTSPSRVTTKHTWAHPRSRGENVRDLAGQQHGRGIIPAHAGKTTKLAPRAPFGWAHPHSRGENFLRHRSRAICAGSSPLMRGKLERGCPRRGGDRLIPAHAGKTLHDPAHRSASKAHPRSRGENRRTASLILPPWGSSPLTQGKPRGEGAPCIPEGLIPTHAGKTKTRAGTWSASRAHPRSRRENYVRREPMQPHQGSSPLTRGKRRGQLFPLGKRGLIPAHAGKTPATG